MLDEHPANDHIADLLGRVAMLLELQKRNRYRIESYRQAAAAVREADRPLGELWQAGGVDGLRSIRGIGSRLAEAIQEILETGRLMLLERLEDAASAETPFVKLPGLHEDEAARIHDALGVESLEELEIAAHDGSLEQVSGMTQPRVSELRAQLEQMLSRSARRRAHRPRPSGSGRVPPIALLLEIDEEYRAKAEAGELRKIAPRRFNPTGERWLPILRGERDGWRYTALYSNTARAHELGATRDWVVIYFRAAGPEDQCTLTTAGRGPLRGRRVVRGREDECREHYGV